MGSSPIYADIRGTHDVGPISWGFIVQSYKMYIQGNYIIKK